MNIKNSLSKWLLSGYSKIGREDGLSYFPNFYETRQPFSQVLFENIIELLTDLVDDTTLILKSGNIILFAEFKTFFENEGQLVLSKLFNKGFALIAYNAAGFKVLDEDQFINDGELNALITSKRYKGSRVYVLKSNTYKSIGKSDRVFLNGFLEYLENVLNASNTATARLGTMVMASPQTPAGANTTSKIDEPSRLKLEKEVSEGYGGLKNQRQIHIWPQQMAFTTINLAGMDSKTIDKAKLAINVICDRIKVPSNQVSVIDASNSNSLSNGGEMREGDLLKYKSFERLLNRTFIRMAKDLDLIIDYSIYNKPTTQTV